MPVATEHDAAVERIRHFERGDIVRLILDGRRQRGLFVFCGMAGPDKAAGTLLVAIRAISKASPRYYAVGRVELELVRGE